MRSGSCSSASARICAACRWATSPRILAATGVDGSAPAMAASTTRLGACGMGRHQPTWRCPATRSSPTPRSRSADAGVCFMAGMHKSEISNPVINWNDTRLPIFTMMQKEYGVFPTPKNFNYFWNFGALAMVTLVIMILTGIFLSMNYQPNTELAFNSVQHIMRDVNYGWLIRYVHQNGASMFFIVTYVHIFRGMYYGSYKTPRELLWMLGVVILLLMMATAFMGYVLPWGQMSYWGATVIANLFSAFPIVGPKIVTLLWGGLSVDNPTLNRFFALHYLLPFVLIGVIFLHIAALHITGSNNPLGIDVKSPQDTLPFHPYYTVKDSVGICVFLIVWSAFIFFAPNYRGDVNNFIPANPLQTPADIVPEW